MRDICTIGPFLRAPGYLPHGFALRDRGEGTPAGRFVVHRRTWQENGTFGHDGGDYFDSLHSAWQSFQFRASQDLERYGPPIELPD